MIFILRLVHVVGGVFWVGSVLFATFILAPSLRPMGPAAGQVMTNLVKVRKMPMVMMFSAILTIGAGIWLMMIASAGQMGLWMQSGPGRTFSTGGLFAILALVVGMAVNLPTSKRMAAIGGAAAARGGPPTAEEAAELQRLQGRLGAASLVVALLLLLTTAAMAIGRYVP